MNSDTNEPETPQSEAASREHPPVPPAPSAAMPAAPPSPPTPPMPPSSGYASSTASAPNTSGATIMLVFGYILILGGILFAIAPIIITSIGCRGSSDGSCGAGAIVVIVTFPVGGLIAAIGATLVAIGTRKRMKLVRAANEMQYHSGTPVYSLAQHVAPAAIAPTARQRRATRRAQWLLRRSVAGAFTAAAIVLAAVGAASANTAFRQGEDVSSFIGPIDLWFFAGLLLVCSVIITRSLRKARSLNSFMGSLLLWQGIFIVAWPFLLLVALGLPAAISNPVSNSFGLDDGTGGLAGPWGLFTASTAGPYAAIFPCIGLGVTMIILSSRSSVRDPAHDDAAPTPG